MSSAVKCCLLCLEIGPSHCVKGECNVDCVYANPKANKLLISLKRQANCLFMLLFVITYKILLVFEFRLKSGSSENFINTVAAVQHVCFPCFQGSVENPH